MNPLDLSSFSVSSLIASFIFSVVGLYVFRKGKKDLDTPRTFIGIALMIYSYFTPTPLLTWGVGFALCSAAYYYR